MKAMNNVEWSYFDKFEELNDKYMPDCGQGDTMASQACTAMAKLVYKWYNDGDVFDNTYYLQGWANDLSSYANWLSQHTPISDELDRISDITSESEYEHILKACADIIYDADYLAELDKKPAIGSIYDCAGDFEFVEDYEEDEDEFEY